jgi:hypothetical protein
MRYISIEITNNNKNISFVNNVVCWSYPNFPNTLQLVGSSDENLDV